MRRAALHERKKSLETVAKNGEISLLVSFFAPVPSKGVVFILIMFYKNPKEAIYLPPFYSIPHINNTLFYIQNRVY